MRGEFCLCTARASSVLLGFEPLAWAFGVAGTGCVGVRSKELSIASRTRESILIEDYKASISYDRVDDRVDDRENDEQRQRILMKENSIQYSEYLLTRPNYVLLSISSSPRFFVSSVDFVLLIFRVS